MKYVVSKEKGGQYYVHPAGAPREAIKGSFGAKKKAMKIAASMCGMSRKEYQKAAKDQNKEEQEESEDHVMEMTRHEIVTSYREAKDKKAQVKILSELNATTKEKIIEELIAGGVKPQELPRNRQKLPKVEKTSVKIEEKASEKMDTPKNNAPSTPTQPTETNLPEDTKIYIPSPSTIGNPPSKIVKAKQSEYPKIVRDAVFYYIEHIKERIQDQKRTIETAELTIQAFEDDIEELRDALGEIAE